jgi:L-lactate permease
MLEIVVVALVQGHQLLPRPLYFNWAVNDWSPYIGQALVGLVIFLVAVTRWRPHHRIVAGPGQS